MKKFLLFSLLGLFVLCATGCQSKEDTCCLVTISTDSNATIESITLGKQTLGYSPGKYYVPYGKGISISFDVKYRDSRDREQTEHGRASVNVNQAKELDVKVGSYYEGSSYIPNLCVWVGGERSKVY